MIQFELSLYDDQETLQHFQIIDYDFWVDRIVTLPSYRPLMLKKAVDYASMYCKSSVFKEKLLKISSRLCPVLLHRLFHRGVLSIDEIIPWMRGEKSFILGYYFRSQIKDFKNYIMRQQGKSQYRRSDFQNEKAVDDMIEYGFVQQSIEYILKYDCVEDLHDYLSINTDPNRNNWSWSPFEWCRYPNNNVHSDLLTFSGIFGSAKCFRVLLINGYPINDSVRDAAYRGGNNEIIHHINHMFELSPHLINLAAEYSFLQLIKFLNEKREIFDNDNSEMKGLFCPLHYACSSGHLSVVHYFINEGIDVNGLDSIKATPLIYACQNGLMVIVEYLLKNGAEVNTVDLNGNTPLLNACRYGPKELIEILVQHGADVFQRDNFDHTLLHRVLDYDSLNIIQYLVGLGLDINAKDKDNGTPLHQACENGNLRVVKYLIEQGAHIDTRREYNFRATPLHCAVHGGYMDIIDFLVTNKANTSIRNQNGQRAISLTVQLGTLDIFEYLIKEGENLKSKDGVFYLHEAANNGFLDIVKYLVQHGVDVNGLMHGSKFLRGTPLYHSYYFNRLDIAEYLTKLGAEIDYSDDELTPLHQAIRSGKIEVVEFLIQSGASLNGIKSKHDDLEIDDINPIENVNFEDIQDIEKWKRIKPKGFRENLMDAVAKGCFASVIHHLSKSSRINAKNPIGESILHTATKNGHFNIVKYLVLEGARINDICMGFPIGSPLHFAAWYGFFDIVEFLITNGANVDLIGDGCFAGTPLHYAVYKGHTRIIHYLIQKGAIIKIKNNEGLTPNELARTDEIKDLLRLTF